MEADKEVDQNLQRPGRKRQWQRKEDFYTTKKKHVTSQAKEQNGNITSNSDEENIEDMGGATDEQNLAIQTALQELHQLLAPRDVTRPLV
ncbi:hypothetical protein NDU88_006180 [Pleurodeles waltl]|uniref:Uncharacterized protein n=1 Tax=Pleurodeles waltl TaxID=8319 RepID=A0AAV7UM87_PLEWA|nr:hypothetical protein NDU88_006180 [Pleurodeles waltl]